MVRKDEKHSNTPYSGNRDDINLEVIDDDPASSKITVQCTVCERRFSIGRTSLRNERQLARKMHSAVEPSSTATLASATSAENEPAAPHAQPSIAVSSRVAEERSYLRDLCKVDKDILSVHRQAASDGTPMLYAKTIDQKLWLLGLELPQATGYPKVMYKNGSTVKLEHALQRCQLQYNEEKAKEERDTRLRLEEDVEWRGRVKAFNLLCDPKMSPRIEDCTTANLDMCVDLLTEPIPPDEDQPIFDEGGNVVGWPPRRGTHVPSHYLYMLPQYECILDYHPPGSLDSPANLLPVLVDIVSKDSRSHRKECVFQLRSKELVKAWLTIDSVDVIKRVFPQLPALLEKPVLSIAFWDDDPIPPPERVIPKVEQVPLLTHASARLMLEHKSSDATQQESPLVQFGLTTEETRLPPSTHDDGGHERRTELKREILRAKAEECLEILSIVCPDDPLLAPEAYAECDATLHKLEIHAAKLIKRVGSLNLGAKPRKLPEFATANIENLEAYQRCNALHGSIVKLHARDGGRVRDGGRAPNLNAMSIEQLETYWEEIAQ
jgi:hypothetical protein